MGTFTMVPWQQLSGSGAGRYGVKAEWKSTCQINNVQIWAANFVSRQLLIRYVEHEIRWIISFFFFFFFSLWLPSNWMCPSMLVTQGINNTITQHGLCLGPQSGIKGNTEWIMWRCAGAGVLVCWWWLSVAEFYSINLPWSLSLHTSVSRHTSSVACTMILTD